MSTNPKGSISFDGNQMVIKDASGNTRVHMGAWDSGSKPRYVKWCIATQRVIDINTQSWPLECDGFIYYREPNEGDARWYAYASRTGIGRNIPPEDVPAEVRLALVLTQ